MTIPLQRIYEEYRAAKKRSGYRSEDEFREIERFLAFLKHHGAEHINYKLALKYQVLRSSTLAKYALQQSYQIIRRFSCRAHLIDNAHEELPKRKQKYNVAEIR